MRDVPRRRRPTTTPTPVAETRPPGGTADWLSPKQAAARVGISVWSIYDACATKGLRHSKLGHSTIRIRLAWLDEWMEKQATS
jgi:excisionase family DNA binding protein